MIACALMFTEMFAVLPSFDTKIVFY